MISRRIIRIKVLQIIYSYFKSESDSLQKSEKELLFSLNKTVDLYYYLLLLIIDINDFARQKTDVGKNKNLPSPEELNPNIRFLENPVIEQIRNNKPFQRYIERNKLSWVNYPELVRNLYNEIKESDIYKEYMSASTATYSDHKNFVLNILGDFISTSELLNQILEEKSIYWNDDLEFVLSLLNNTIHKLKEGKSEQKELIVMYKNDEDKEFVVELFRLSILRFSENQKLIHDFTKNWELERIAFMDMLMMSQAITEVMNFESIPVKVSMNEYIEIAKYYSTHKSSIFINGVLDKIVEHLKTEKRIIKTGRGLIDS